MVLGGSLIQEDTIVGIPVAEGAVFPQAATCPACRQVFKSQMALYGHRRTCKHQPQPPIQLHDFSGSDRFQFGPMMVEFEPQQLSSSASSSAAQPAAHHREIEAQPQPPSQPTGQAQLGWDMQRLNGRLASIEARMVGVAQAQPVQPVQPPQKGLWGWLSGPLSIEKLIIGLIAGYVVVQVVKYVSAGAANGGQAKGRGIGADLFGYAGKKLVDQFIGKA